MMSPKTANSKLLWMIIGGMSIIVLALFSAQWLLSNHTTETEIATSQPEVASTSLEENVDATSSIVTQSMIDENESAPIQLIEESVLKAAVPNNESLAKEEIAKLDDIQHQLQDQKQELQAQHNDADTLIKLKEEQIKLLEAQLLQTRSS